MNPCDFYKLRLTPDLEKWKLLIISCKSSHTSGRFLDRGANIIVRDGPLCNADCQQLKELFVHIFTS